MTASSRKDVQQLRRDVSGEMERLAMIAAQKGMRGEQATDEIERIEALQKALAGLPAKSTNPIRWAAATGAICLIAASVAGTIPVRKARIQLDLSSASTSLRLAQDFSWSGFWRINPELIQLKDFIHLGIPPEYRKGNPSPFTTLSLKVSDGRAWISDLDLRRGALITIGQSNLITTVIARGARFRGHIDVIGSITCLVNQGAVGSLPDLRFDPDEPPGLFEFDYVGGSSGGNVNRALLRVTPAEQVTMREVPVSGLGFFEQRADGSGDSDFASQIVFGTIIMVDTGEHIRLPPSAALQLEDAEGVVTALQITPNATRVQFEGSVRGATLGSGEFIRHLKPTILEWLFHQQTLGLLWGALAFLFGTAVSARKFLYGE